jgi:hypothetical protein
MGMQNRSTTVHEVYAYPDTTWSTVDLSGFKVEALDGEIGSIDDATYEVGADALIVDTGPWIFGRKVMLPAGVISRIDTDDRRVWVNRTKDQIQNAPELDESRWRDSAYRDELGTYYAGHADRPAGPDYGLDDRTNR